MYHDSYGRSSEPRTRPQTPDPEHLFLSSAAELHPWRQPEDCLRGCMALATSVAPVLADVAAARERSLSAMYKFKPVSNNASARRSGSNGGPRDELDDDSCLYGANHGIALGSGREHPLAASDSGGASPNLQRTVVLKSERSQRRAAERSAGATLLDMVRGSSGGRSQLSPPRPVAAAADSDDAVRRSSTGSGARLGNKARGQFLPLSKSPSINTSHAQGSSTALSVGSHDRPGAVRGSCHSRAQHSPGQAMMETDTVNGSPMAPSEVPAVFEEHGSGSGGGHHHGSWGSPNTNTNNTEDDAVNHTPATSGGEACRRRLSLSPSPPVPDIPRFREFMDEKERLLRQLEEEQRRSGKPPAAAMRGKRAAAALFASDSDNENHNSNASDSYDDNGTRRTNTNGRRASSAAAEAFVANLARLSTGRGSAPSDGDDDDDDDAVSLSPPSLGMPPSKATARPHYYPPAAGAHPNIRDDDDDSLSDGDKAMTAASTPESSEMTMGHPSEGNFAEGGHYVCVPGDTLNNRYTLIHPLGVGRSSRVWLAADLDHCSSSRTQLARSLGEERVRRMYDPKARPMFVAIKVFRCGETYSECAEYESGVMQYIKEATRPSSTGGRRRQAAMLGASLNSELGASRTPERAALHASTRTTTTTTPQHEQQQLGSSASQYVAVMRDQFTVDGEYGTHHCIVMDVAGAGVDKVINETHLRGLPLDISRSILSTALQGLAVLASLHIIHTDIKPENLLFIDLEKKTADTMEEFQRLRRAEFTSAAAAKGATAALRQEPLAHRRAPVSEYVSACASVRASTARTPHGLGLDGDTITNTTTTAGSCGDPSEPSTLLPTPLHGDSRRPSGNSIDAVAAAAAAAAAATPPPSLPKWGTPATPMTAAAARALYEVKVSDYGLSFIVPPALRDGTETMRRLTQEFIEAQSRQRRSGSVDSNRSASGAGGAGGGRNGRRPKRASVSSSTGSASYDRGSSSSSSGGSGGGGHKDCDDGAAAPIITDEDGVGNGVLKLPPLTQFRLLQRHRQALLEAAVQRQQRAEGGDGEERTTAGPRDGDAGNSNRNDTVGLHARATNGTSRALGQQAAPTLHEQPRSPPMLSGGRRVPVSPMTDLTVGGESPLSGVGSTFGAHHHCPSSGASFGRSTAFPRATGAIGSLVLQAQRPPSETEMGVLRSQIYGRGITIQSREYRSPEVILGCYFLPSCDIWSIGCVAYELVTGGFLFDVRGAHEDALYLRRKQRARQRELRRKRAAPRAFDYDDRYGGIDSDSDDYDDDDDDDEEESDDEELMNAPLYFDDNDGDGVEKDVDVVHLKCVMRLLGPPPVAFLAREPRGVFVYDFFSPQMEFLFFDHYSVFENEEEELGMCSAQPFREAELRALHAPYQLPSALAAGRRSSSPGEHRSRSHSYNHTTGSGGHGSAAAAIVYHYSDDDDDEFEELTRTLGAGATIVHHRRSASICSSSSPDVKLTGAAGASLTAPTPPKSSTMEDVTPSTLPVSPAAPHFFPGGAGHPTTAAATAQGWAGPGGGPARPAPPPTTRDPSDSSNYPICTRGWRQLQQTIREHIQDEEEAQCFEEFLRMCLQWDPAKRATPAELLASRWLTGFGPMASTASLANTMME